MVSEDRSMPKMVGSNSMRLRVEERFSKFYSCCITKS